jgi:hypothetical protein
MFRGWKNCEFSVVCGLWIRMIPLLSGMDISVEASCVGTLEFDEKFGQPWCPYFGRKERSYAIQRAPSI